MDARERKELYKIFEDIINNYEMAVDDTEVEKPYSWAIYHTWKKWTSREPSRKTTINRWWEKGIFE